MRQRKHIYGIVIYIQDHRDVKWKEGMPTDYTIESQCRNNDDID